MLCTHPGQRTDANGYRSEYPCGQCMPCRINRQSAWAGRILLESRSHLTSAFVTLTYTDQALPRTKETGTPTLRKRHLQLFLKRLRASLKVKIRYFGCGEYGSSTSRPHYHLILFGYPFDQINLIQEAWKQGFTSCFPLGIQHAPYVAKYTTKVQRGSNSQIAREQPFALMSQKPGLGTDYLPRVAEAVSKSPLTAVPNQIRIDGKLYKLDAFMQLELKTLILQLNPSLYEALRRDAPRDLHGNHLSSIFKMHVGDHLMVHRETCAAQAKAAMKFSRETEKL